LARSLDRRAHITAELKKTSLDYEIITAVDGRDLDLSDPAIVDSSFPIKGELAYGTIGAAMSHLRVYQRILADGLDVALVLEDDIMLPADLGELAEVVAGQLAGAEVALLSYDSPDPCKMGLEGSASLPAAHVLALPIDISQPRSAGAYVITREACERMVKCLLPIRVQADTWWSFYRDGMLDRVRCVVPMPVLKNAKFTSTIGSYSMLGSGIKARVGSLVTGREIPVLHHVLSYRRQRIFRQWSRSELVDGPFIERPSRLD
jgi:glycosyl transferase family 25